MCAYVRVCLGVWPCVCVWVGVRTVVLECLLEVVALIADRHEAEVGAGLAALAVPRDEHLHHAAVLEQPVHTQPKPVVKTMDLFHFSMPRRGISVSPFLKV